MDRRKFLGISLGAAALPLVESCRSDTKWLPLLSKPSTVTQFCDEKELLAIGRAYSDKFPDETKGKLQRLLLADQDPTSEQDLLSRIEQAKKNDFRNRATVIANGWVLSRTEARQCALYTLTAK
jgi:hypothetical protein